MILRMELRPGFTHLQKAQPVTRRLISYIYAYEGGEKGKNIGFAGIGTRTDLDLQPERI